MSEMTDAAAADERPCTKCGRVKPLAEFYSFKKGKHGRRPDCKSCHNAYHNDWARARYEPKVRGRYKPRRRPQEVV